MSLYNIHTYTLQLCSVPFSSFDNRQTKRTTIIICLQVLWFVFDKTHYRPHDVNNFRYRIGLAILNRRRLHIIYVGYHLHTSVRLL